MMLCEPDQCHQIALVDRESGFDRFALSRVIAGTLVDPGKIEPEYGCVRIGLRGRLEMTSRRRQIAADKRFCTEDVVRDRMIRPLGQCRLGVANRIRPAPLLLRLARPRQLLFDRRHRLIRSLCGAAGGLKSALRQRAFSGSSGSGMAKLR